MRILIGDTVVRRDGRRYTGIVERRNNDGELSVRLPYDGNQRERVLRDEVEPMAKAMARARRDGTKFRHGLNLVNYGSTLAELVEAFGYATTERLRRDSLEKVIAQLQRAGLQIDCESDRWGRDDRFELSVVSAPTKHAKGGQPREDGDEPVAGDSSAGSRLHEISLPTPFWPAALGLEEQRELSFLRALTEADPILCLLDASSSDGWIQVVWEGIVSWAFRGAQRFCHRTLSDAPQCEARIGSPAMLQAYLRTSVVAQDGPRLRDEPHSLNLITLNNESEKPVEFLRLGLAEK